MEKSGPKTIRRVKTGFLERRLSMMKAGLIAGTRAAAQSATTLMSNKTVREKKQREILSTQAQWLVNELSQLKGSVVKIGQMMALYGEHFLPDELTRALHALESDTSALVWRAIEPVLKKELGAAILNELEIDTTPVGAASLSQVHRAVRKSDGREFCLKIQYPGVADAIDSDLNAVAQLLRFTKLLPGGRAADNWLEEIRAMLHQEVDYTHELRSTCRFGCRLHEDKRFIVPEVFPDYSTSKVLALSFEEGIKVDSETVSEFSLERRNYLANAMLELFFKEMYLWNEFQTDPNFGNYLIRPGQNEQPDRIVLLDFGAVKSFEKETLTAYRDMIEGAANQQADRVMRGSCKLGIMQSDFPEHVLHRFADLCMNIIEPLTEDIPLEVLNEKGEYLWGRSNLPARVAKRAGKAALSSYFKIPPMDFMFMVRKLTGVYTFISVLDAEFNGRDLMLDYIHRADA